MNVQNSRICKYSCVVPHNSVLCRILLSNTSLDRIKSDIDIAVGQFEILLASTCFSSCSHSLMSDLFFPLSLLKVCIFSQLTENQILRLKPTSIICDYHKLCGSQSWPNTQQTQVWCGRLKPAVHWEWTCDSERAGKTLENEHILHILFFF